jgi:broad specificity phosphatase PhoE
MRKTIHLIRHGQSTFNVGYEALGVDPMLHDAPLSPLGYQQAAALRKTLAATSFDLVVTSPLTRALQTCLGIFDGRGIPYLVETLHREHRGSSCDIGRSPLELAKEFPAFTFDHLEDPWWYVDAAGGTEPEDLLMARVSGFRDWLTSRSEQSIAVIGHGTFFSRLAGRQLANCEMCLLNV